MALRASEPHMAASFLHVVQQDDAATSQDVMQVMAYLRAMTLHLTDVAWQHREKLLDDQTLNGAVMPMRATLSMGGVQAVWRMLRPSLAPEMVSVVEGLLTVDTLPASKSSDRLAAWRATLAQIQPTITE